MRPTSETPRNIIAAPMGVTRTDIASQKVLPNIPAWPKDIIEMKNNKPPTITLGCPRENLTFETRKAKDKNIKGRRKDDQEK